MEILCIVTGGSGDSLRARYLTQAFGSQVTFFDVDRSLPRFTSCLKIRKLLSSRHWSLVYQEGSGIASGLNLIDAAITRGQPYIVSSGDPIGGFFQTTQGALLGQVFTQYESLLYRHCAGFVGWTPYLTGMALKMGARRAMTVEGAVDLETFQALPADDRQAVRAQLGIPENHLVLGIVGSLKWTPRQLYCYGLELIEMLKYLHRRDVSVLIVGDGDGRAILESRIPEEWRSQVFFTGRLHQAEVVKAMGAMDIGFLAQTLDGLGNYRLSTKLPEYLACGLPIAMSPVAGFWDYILEVGWSLPAYHPASDLFHRQCAQWLDQLSFGQVREKAARARQTAITHFDYRLIASRFTQFVEWLLAQDAPQVASRAQRPISPLKF